VSEQDEKVLKLIKHGGAIGGGATGSVLGFLAGGPIGAAIGGVVGATLQTVAIEVANRALARREAMRIGGTTAYAIDFIHERLKRGDRPREDTFFIQGDSGTSPAEELFEGVLQKAKGDHEERKARFYGLLFANVTFDPKCSSSEANYLLHVMDRLTFLQLTLISLFSDATRFPKLPEEDYEQKSVSFELLNALTATFELFQNGILKLWKRGDKEASVVFDSLELRPAHMVLSSAGKRLFELAGLGAIGDSTDVGKLADLFATASPAGGEVAASAVAVLRNK
jgi:hypothetical protein